MGKKESSFLNMVISLLIVTLTSSAVLGFIYNLTKEPIERVKMEAKREAISIVVPEFNNMPVEDSYKKYVDGDTLYFYRARNSSRLVGTAVETFTNKGFSGYIKLMVGILPNGKINNIVVLEHKETPGLGDKMSKEKSDFGIQFIDKDPAKFDLRVSKDGGDVDAITAATISSRAYSDAVQRAYNAYIKKGGNNESNQ